MFFFLFSKHHNDILYMTYITSMQSKTNFIWWSAIHTEVIHIGQVEGLQVQVPSAPRGHSLKNGTQL